MAPPNDASWSSRGLAVGPADMESGQVRTIMGELLIRIVGGRAKPNHVQDQAEARRPYAVSP